MVAQHEFSTSMIISILTHIWSTGPVLGYKIVVPSPISVCNNQEKKCVLQQKHELDKKISLNFSIIGHSSCGQECVVINHNITMGKQWNWHLRTICHTLFINKFRSRQYMLAIWNYLMNDSQSIRPVQGSWSRSNIMI